MASLTDKRIKNTYDGLLKTTDNDALGGTYKLITDGLGNSSGVYLGTGGSVGINVSSPSYKLHVGGTAGIQGVVEIDGNLEVAQGFGGDRCLFINTSTGAFEIGDASGLGDYAFISGDSSSLSMQVNQNVGLHIDSNSNVGIKTTSPTQALDVSGNVTANRYYGRTNTTYYIDPNDTTQSIYVAGDIRITDSSTATIKLDSTSIYPQQKIIATRNGSESPNMGEISWNDNPGFVGSQWISRIYTSPYTSSSVTLPTSTSRDFEVNLLGTERFRIDSSTGNVGIGTTSPDRLLVLNHASDTRVKLQVNGTDTAQIQTLTNEARYHALGSSTSLQLWTNGGERARINTSGNVGIGTTSPSSILHVSSDAPVISGTSTNNSSGLRYNVTGTADTIHRFQYNGSTLMTIKGNGNVGIGTISPDVALEVVGNGIRVSDGTDQGIVYFRTDRNDVYIKENGSFQVETGAPSGIVFECDTNSNGFGTFDVKRQGSSRFYITDGGNVGIGTTSPAEKLTVSASDDVVIRINSTKNGTWTAGDSLGALEFFGNDASGNGVGIKGKIDITSVNQYGAAFDMKFFTSNGASQPSGENFKIAYDGGIFAPALLGSSASNPDVRYNTTTDELYYNSSSIRYKEDITDLENSLDKINNLRPVKFKDKESGEYATGLIAEEVVDVLPELVFKRQIEGFDEPQIDGVSYGDLHAYYIKAIQQLKSEIEILKSQIN